MEKISIPWKTVKGTWNSSLLKKVFRRWNYEVAWKMAEGSGTKGWIRCSIKFLVKMKNVSFYVKNRRHFFLAHPIFCSLWSVGDLKFVSILLRRIPFYEPNKTTKEGKLYIVRPEGCVYWLFIYLCSYIHSFLFLYFLLKKNIYIYIFIYLAVPGLSCSTRGSSLPHERSLVVGCGI